MVKFLNCFEVPAGMEDEFLEHWREVNAYMAAKPGYVGHRLHRSVSPDAKYRFVNYVEWSSPQTWADAHDDGFRALVSQSHWTAFTTTPALYDVVHENGTV